MRARTRGGLVLLAAAGIAAAATFNARGAAGATGGLTYAPTTVGDYGGEPSIVSDSNGVLYEDTPSGGTVLYRSTDHGLSWQKRTTADTNSGDDCLGVDQSNAVYQCNLQIVTSQGVAPLQADEWKTTDGGATWMHGDGAISGTCSTSCSPFGVDRDWTDAAILPPATSTDQAEVVLMYHDFYGLSQIWVNISQDGGKTFGAPIGVLTSPAVTPGAVAGSLVAEGFTFCSTVPAGTGIVRPGHPHAGRIYVAWIAADAAQDALGCNLTQAQAFDTLFMSYSDDKGATWTTQMAYDAGLGHDASTPFVAFTIDDQGNPYFAFAVQGPGDNAAVCSAESLAGTLQSDTSCAYNMYVIWSQDGGQTWGDGTGLVPGSAGTAYQVNPPSEVGTHFYPAISVRDPGKVDVAYLFTPTLVPTDAAGKTLPGGCAGPDTAGVPTFPPPCNWYLYAGQTSLLTADPANTTWTTTRVTGVPMHIGDICNLGIACGPTSNRNLLDFIQTAIDPTTGCAHIAYPDDNTVNKLRVANQTTGCFAVAAATTTATPTPTPTSAPAAALNGSPNTASAPPGLGTALGVAGMLGIGLPMLRRRRRRRAR